MHHVIRDLIRQACQAADKWRQPSPSAFGLLVAATLAVSQIDHWYSDIEETKQCYLIAQQLSLQWRAALAHRNVSLGIDSDTREALVAKLDVINQEWLSNAPWDNKGRFHIRFRTGKEQQVADAAAKASAQMRAAQEARCIEKIQAKAGAKRKAKATGKARAKMKLKAKPASNVARRQGNRNTKATAVKKTLAKRK